MKLIFPGKSLSQRVVHAGFWAFALRASDRLFGLARIVILARLLSPHDFGLFGIALLAMMTLEALSRPGFDQALTQRKGSIAPHLNSAWTVQVIHGLIIALILVGTAPFVASFFGEPNAVPLLWVVGLIMLVRGLKNIGVVYLQRELEFHKQFAYMFSGTLVDLGVSISLALLLRNPLALVLGFLAGDVVRLAVSYLIHPYRPRLRIDWARIKELYSFGKWVFLSSVVILIITQGDDLFVGKMLGATALAFYQMAYRLSNLPATEITHVISQVSFPAYAKLQDNLESLGEAFLRVLRTVSVFSIPVAAGGFILAEDFTLLILGDKWLPIVAPIQVLLIFGLIRSITASMGALLSGLGKPHLVTGVSVLQLVLMGALIYPLTLQWGIWGTALATTLPNAVTLVVVILVVARVLRRRLFDLLECLMVPVGAAAVMTLVMVALRFAVDFELSNFFLGAVVGLVTYGVAVYILDRVTGRVYQAEVGKLLSRVGTA